jgi:hypothetical protein
LGNLPIFTLSPSLTDNLFTLITITFSIAVVLYKCYDKNLDIIP